ncbi:hypothetical protein MWN41_06510 [Ornithobacterium rhinotracheale]|uniref:hypothetical protein n=1 Tax=Ornithobacterium rhinotracheale TaxID=28251 RepID=UPI00129CAEB3|nr:hypothetical protein [Ornithobacterium rhinotracheale]MCK0202670.1 hypothetical protein [Ornithobacterium rhinotracheale]MRI64456.1 hypothetical protein [Ornithobacterium rhinotracheale]MRI64497.1 hypothetical protein [Ornithobacterium rhinotracheale]MRJ09320.1 hypothetical protein [Ornithobacterium rhinotracheale]MRJ11531.1 hypothetical protein [Ornithobacterium rhinotracheale]
MNETICGLSPEEIEQLKAEKGALVLVTVNYAGQAQNVIFKEPTFQQLEALSKISKSNEMKAVQSAYANYIVKADEEIEQRDMLKAKAVEALMARMQKTTAEAKNL